MHSIIYNNDTNKTSNTYGFTIVELLVVIVVIGILAIITIVSYNGITERAIAASLESDLDRAQKQLSLDQIFTGNFPSSLQLANGGDGISISNGSSYKYYVDNTTKPKSFCLTATNGDQSYNIDQTGNLLEGGKNIIPFNEFSSITNLTETSFEASNWAYTLTDNSRVLEIFEPNTTYYVKAKYTLVDNSALPIYSHTTGFNLYSSATGSVFFGVNSTMTSVGDVYEVNSSFTTPASLADKRLLFYTKRYTDGMTVELGKVRVEYLKIEKTSNDTCWTPA